MMANDLILFLLKANLVLGAAVMLVLALRKPVRAAFGARNAYALWLIAPLSILALLIPARTVVRSIEPATIAGIAPRPTKAATFVETSSRAADALSTLPSLPEAEILLTFWAVVALGGLHIQAGRQRRFVRSLGKLSVRQGVLWSDCASVGPAVIGALIPRVVLPSDFGERYTLEERTLILAHEKKHLAGGDAQINAVVAGLQCLFWFNPLVHLGAAMLRIDQEIACDAAVLARHPRSRRIYGEAMLKTLLAPDAPPIGCHWPASANKQLKERFILLARHHADRRRHLAGAAVVTILSLSAGAAAWAGQPPQIIQRTLDRASRTVASPLDRLLFSSIRAGDATSVRALIARGANPDATLPGDGSSLIEAARDGHAEIVRLLLAAGVDPNRGVPDDGTPLIQASLSGRLDIVRLLVERGADVEGYVPGDETPLIRAAQVGSIEVATYLVERGADVNRAVEADPGQMRSPLGEARKNGHDIVANFLMRKGARS